MNTVVVSEGENIPSIHTDGIPLSSSQAKFPSFKGGRREAAPRSERRPLTEKDRLVQKFHQLQQDIQTYENNIGFFGLSKGAETLKAQMQERIDAAKAELLALRDKIRQMDQAETEE